MSCWPTWPASLDVPLRQVIRVDLIERYAPDDDQRQLSAPVWTQPANEHGVAGRASIPIASAPRPVGPRRAARRGRRSKLSALARGADEARPDTLVGPGGMREGREHIAGWRRPRLVVA